MSAPTPESQHAAVSAYWAEGWLALYRSLEARFVLEQTKGILPLHWLDAGCGEGRFAAILEAGAHEYAPGIGLDADEDRMRRSADAHLHAARLIANLESLPLRSNYLPLIIANSVLEHVENPQACIREFARVLRPGGRLLVTVPSEKFDDFLAGTQLLDLIGLHSLADRYADAMSQHIKHYHSWSIESISAALNESGLEVTGHSGFGTRRFSALGDLLHLVRIVGVGGSRFSRLPEHVLERRRLLSRVAAGVKRLEHRWIDHEASITALDGDMALGMVCVAAIKGE